MEFSFRLKMKQMVFFAICFVLTQAAFGQSSLEKGFQQFYKNQRTEAKKHLQDALNVPNEKAEAHLLLSIIATSEGKEKEAFTQFEQFFNLSPNPYPYLYALWNTASVFGSNRKKTPERLRFLNQLLTDPKMNGTLKAKVFDALGDHFISSNQLEKGKEYYSKMGTVDQWSMAGEFENISESGFDKPFDPILKPENNAEFTNKNGAKVKWFPMKGNRFDRWVDFEFHFFTENSILFAQSFVKCPVDQDVILRVGTSGSLKTWLNDMLVIQEPEETNNGLDTYQAKVKLNQGFNRILVQIGSSEINQSNFMVRITDENANPVPGLNFSNGFQAYKKAPASPLPERIPIFAEAFFEEKIEKGTAQVIDYLILANVYLPNDKGYEARKVLAKAQILAPKCSYLKVKQTEAFNRSGNETDSKITIEWLKEHDPDNILSINLFLDEALENERFEAASALVDKMEKLYGADENTVAKRIELASKEKKQDLVVKLVEAAYLNYPDNFSFVSLKAEVEQAINKSPTRAISVWKKFLKTNYTYEAQKAVSDLYMGMSATSDGLSAFDLIIKNSPYSPGYQYNLGKFYFGTRDYAKAETYYQTCLDIAPNIFYFWSALAAVHNEKGDKTKAIECYQRALELNPTDFETREQQRKLNNKPEIFSYFPKVDVYDLVKKAVHGSAFPEDNSLVILDEVQKVVYAGGVSEEKRIFVVKILKPDAIDRWKQYYIEHYATQQYDVEKAEVIKSNGSKIEGTSNGDEIVFTNLEVGDAFHVTYRLKSFNTGKLANHFWETFHFSHFMPYLKTRYSLLVEKGTNFEFKFSKEKIEPSVEQKDEFLSYTWERYIQPALPYEDRMPELTDVGNLLYISSIPDWTFVSNWYHDLATSKSKVNLEVREAVDQIFTGKQNLSEMEKAKMIYEFIVTNIKYISVSFLQSGLIPQKASHTLNTKLGDCKDVSTLFVAMCKQAGLSAELVLIATRNLGKHQLLLPGIDFNHCIARLISGGKEYFIELTSDKLPFNVFYDDLLNASALEIYSESSGTKAGLIHLNPTTRNRNFVFRQSEMRFEEQTVVVKKENQKTGVFASNMRNTFRDMGQQDQMKEMQKAIAGDFNQTILKNLSFKNLQGISDTVFYSYEFRAPEATTEIGGMHLLTLPWSEKSKATDFNFTEDRLFPLDLWQMESDGEEETILVYFPSKTKLAESPQNVNISSSVADYSMNYKSSPEKLTVTRKFRYKKDLINSGEMKEFEGFYRKVVATDNRQLALKKNPVSPTESNYKKAQATPK